MGFDFIGDGDVLDPEEPSDAVLVVDNVIPFLDLNEMIERDIRAEDILCM